MYILIHISRREGDDRATASSRVLCNAPLASTGEYWRGIAMLGMFNTGATTRHGEMVGFNRGINLVESYPPLAAISCLPRALAEKFFRGGETLIAFLYVTLRLMEESRGSPRLLRKSRV